MADTVKEKLVLPKEVFVLFVGLDGSGHCVGVYSSASGADKGKAEYTKKFQDQIEGDSHLTVQIYPLDKLQLEADETATEPKSEGLMTSFNNILEKLKPGPFKPTACPECGSKSFTELKSGAIYTNKYKCSKCDHTWEGNTK